ncbi:MAG: hypothetical protein NC115_07320 [Bacteroidales bacterium]|nr:hypothetical protein [Bacteroidales bacterium]
MPGDAGKVHDVVDNVVAYMKECFTWQKQPLCNAIRHTGMQVKGIPCMAGNGVSRLYGNGMSATTGKRWIPTDIKTKMHAGAGRLKY